MENVIREKTFNFALKFITYNSQFTIYVATDPGDEFHSPYTYCANNPVMFTDPSGEKMTDELKRLPQFIEMAKTEYGKQYIDNLEKSKIIFSLGNSFASEGKKTGRVKKIKKDGKVVEVIFEFNKDTFLFDIPKNFDDNTKMIFFKNIETTFHEILHCQDTINGETNEQAIYVPQKVDRWKDVLLETAIRLDLPIPNDLINEPINKEGLSLIEELIFNSHDLKSNLKYFKDLGGELEKDKPYKKQ